MPRSVLMSESHPHKTGSGSAIDRQIKPNLRIRATGSMYLNNKSVANTLYAGDRGGSPYFCVMENAGIGCGTSQAFSGRIDPGFSYKVRAFQFNPFVKYRGLELFVVIENAEGMARTELTTRTWNQYAIDAVYRFASDKLFAGVRYNYTKGALAGITSDVNVDRLQVGGGWFIMPYLLLKAEFVNQNYNNFPANNILSGGDFHGIIGHAVLAF